MARREPAARDGFSAKFHSEGTHRMNESIHEFIISSLREMNYDVEGITENTVLGPRGADVESLSLAELAIRVEDAYGVKFLEDEAESLAGMTVGEFCDEVARRMPTAAAGAE
jgi:acyl carrier protein